MDRVLVVAVVAVVVAFDISTIPGIRAEPGFAALFDGWFQLGGYVLASLLAANRAARRSTSRGLWVLVAVAIALRALGFLLYVPWIRTLQPQPYPSVADAAWIASQLVLLGALVVRLRARSARLPPPVVLDAITGAAASAALAVALLYRVVVDLNAATSPSATVVNLAYPVLDVALFVLVLSLLTATGWRPSPARGVLGLGIVIGAVVDSVFLYQVSAGTYRPGTWVAALALTGTGLMALATLLPDDDPPPRPLTSQPGLWTPAGFAVVSLGVLVAGTFRSIPGAALLLATAAIVVAMVRALFSYSRDRQYARYDLAAANEETARFQSLVETSEDFIALAGLDGRVRYVNPAGRALVGLDPDHDVEGMQLADFQTPEGRRLSEEVEQPAVRRHGHWAGESTLRDLRGGAPIPVAVSSFLMRGRVKGEPFVLATVQRDISERLANLDALRRLADERQELLSRLVQAQEEERARIAADVHDDSVQILAALELRLWMVRTQAEQLAPQLVETVDSSLATLSQATARLRELLFNLERPAQSTDLASAIDDAAAHVFEGLGIRVEVQGDRSIDLPEGARITAYRIAKEALVNVRKHAQARHVVVGLKRERQGVLVTIDDDGVGIGTEPIRGRPGHRGLSSMRDRATVAGGEFNVAPRPEGGTRMSLWLPERDAWVATASDETEL